MNLMFLKNFFNILAVSGTLSLTHGVMADNFTDAQDALSQGQYSTAIIHLKNTLKDNPKNARARFLLGEAYSKTGKPESALKEFSRAYEYGNSHPEYLLRYAEVLQATGDHDKVIELLKQPLTEPAEDALRLSLLGFSYLSQQRLADAKTQFEASNGSFPNPNAYSGLAALAVMDKDIAHAQQLLDKALKLEPENIKTLRLKAKLMNQEQQAEKALALYTKAIQLAPGNLALYLERSATYLRLNQDEAAREDVQVVLAKVKQHPQANALLAQLELKQKNFEAAKMASQQVLNVLPSHMGATYMLGVSSFALKQFNQAEEYLTLYTSNHPKDINAQNILANVYLAQQQPEQALLILNSMPQAEQASNPAYWLALGQAHAQLRAFPKALEALTQAQTLAPDNQDIQKQLVALQLQTGKVDEAIAELEQMSVSGQSDGHPDIVLVMTYLKQQRMDKAEAKINELLITQPTDVRYQNLKALVLQQQGETDKAKAQYQSILNQDNKNLPALMGLARLEGLASNWSQSEKYFNKVLDIEPKTIKAYLGLIAVAQKQNQPQKIEQIFEKALKNTQDNLTVQLQLAHLAAQWYQENQQPEKTLQLAEKLTKQHEQDKAVQVFLAKAQVLNQQSDKAERTLKNILLFDKQDISTRLLLAQLIGKDTKRIEEAAQLYQEAQKLEPENLTPYNLEALLYIQSKDWDKALKVANTLQKQFEDTNGILMEADIYRAQKDYQKSLPLYEQAYQEKPNDKVLNALTETLMALRQTHKVTQILQQAADNHSQNTQALFTLASIYHGQQQLEKARALYQQILVINPNQVPALNNLAWLVVENDTSQAVSLAKKAYEQNQSADIADTYGYCLYRDNQFEKALKVLQKAAQEKPGNMEIQYHLAQVYSKNNQQQAQALLSKILKSNPPSSIKKQAEVLLDELK